MEFDSRLLLLQSVSGLKMRSVPVISIISGTLYQWMCSGCCCVVALDESSELCTVQFYFQQQCGSLRHSGFLAYPAPKAGDVFQTVAAASAVAVVQIGDRLAAPATFGNF